MGPCRASTISRRVMRSAGRASLNPPRKPRLERSSPLVASLWKIFDKKVSGIAVAREISRISAGWPSSRRARYRIPSMPYSTPLVNCTMSPGSPRPTGSLVTDIKGVVKMKWGGSGPVRPADAVGAHFSIEVASLKAQELRRPHDVSARLLEFLQDELSLEVLAPLAQRRHPSERVRRGFGVGADGAPDFREPDDSPGRQDHQALDHVFQLAHVSGPARRLQ